MPGTSGGSMCGETAVTFEDVLDQALAMLQRRGRVTYRTLQLQFQLDDDTLEALKEEILYSQPQAVDDPGHGLVWGTPVAVPVSAATPSPVPALPVVHPVGPLRTEAAERRQLTVMFCDLVGSTSLAARLDPEAWREVVRAYQTTCVEAIQHFGGDVAQYLGDGLLVYFGYPEAHEDDAQRAVHAGLALLVAMQALNTRLAAQSGVQLALRIGIHTGLVVVGEVGAGPRQEVLALGDAPNLAARLQGMAEPNTIAISAATFHLVQGYFACDDLGLHPLKGMPTPLQVYRVRGPSGAQSRLEVAATRGLPPLVGREQEMGVLLARWQQAGEGQGQVVLLRGEAGIGKSRLVEALHERLGQSHCKRVTLRCSPYAQHSALYPLTEYLHRRLQWQRHDTLQDKVEKLERAVRAAHGTLAETVPLFAALLGVPLSASYAPLTLSPQQQKRRTHAALVAWLLAEAAPQPVLAVWEDLHWADPSTLEVLELFLEQAPTARILTVLTCRAEFHPPWAARSFLTPLTLARLTSQHAEQLVLRVTDGKPLPPEVLAHILAKTDGVPLFVEELTKTLIESGALSAGRDCYTMQGALPVFAIPATLHDSLMARLDRLVTAKGIAQLGAVIGRRFAYDLLRAVSQLDDATLQRELGRLVEAELLYQRGLPPHATYTFKHALVQDTAYQSLLKSTRQQYHRQIAQALTTHFPESVAAQPELLAHHYTEAGLPAQAVDAWKQAGLRADAHSAYAEALAHFTKALEVLHTMPETPPHTQEALDLHTALGWSLQATKGYASPEAERIYTRAMALCQQVGDRVQHVHVLMGLWAVRALRAELVSARKLGERLLSLAQKAPDTPVPALAHMALGFTLFHLGELTTASIHLAQGVVEYHAKAPPDSLWRIGGAQDPKALCLAYTARVLWFMGYPDQAMQRSHEALAHAQALGHSFTLLHALVQGAAIHRWRGEMAQVWERNEAALALATEQGVEQFVALRMLHRGLWLLQNGREQEGMREARQGLAAYRALGVGLELPYLLGQLAEAYGNLGRPAEGLETLAEALARMEASGERWWAAELYRLRGALLCIEGERPHRLTEAEAWMQQALEIARSQQAKSLELRAAMSLGRLWQQQGRHAAARQLLAEIVGWFTEGLDTADLKQARTLLAVCEHSPGGGTA